MPLCADPSTAFRTAPALLSKWTIPCLGDLPSCWLPPGTAVKVCLLCRRFGGGYISPCLPGLLQELSLSLNIPFPHLGPRESNKTGPCSVAQAGLELTTILPQPAKRTSEVPYHSQISRPLCSAGNQTSQEQPVLSTLSGSPTFRPEAVITANRISPGHIYPLFGFCLFC